MHFLYTGSIDSTNFNEEVQKDIKSLSQDLKIDLLLQLIENKEGNAEKVTRQIIEKYIEIITEYIRTTILFKPLFSDGK